MIRSSPRQLQAALFATLTGRPRRGVLQTGDAFLGYERFCNSVGLKPLTQRAFSDLICELDMYGFIRARTVSRGRYGRSKEIRVSLADAIQRKLIEVIGGNFQGVSLS
jgi:Cdc6-like AAA superfamily ATPase